MEFDYPFRFDFSDSRSINVDVYPHEYSSKFRNEFDNTLIGVHFEPAPRKNESDKFWFYSNTADNVTAKIFEIENKISNKGEK